MRFRWTFIAICLLGSLFVLFRPQEKDNTWTTPNIKLGLDLQGGIYMQLEVDVEDAAQQYVEEQAGTIKTTLESENFTVAAADSEPAKGIVKLTGVSKEGEDPQETLRKFYGDGWNITRTSSDIDSNNKINPGSDFTLTMRSTEKSRVENEAVEQTVYKIRNRIDELGVTEPVINRAMNSNRIILELAGADDVQRVHNIVKEPGKLEWRMMAYTASNANATAETEAQVLAAFGGQLPTGVRIFPYEVSPGRIMYVPLKEVLLTSQNLSNVFVTTDRNGLPAVGIALNREGGNRLNEISGQNIGRQLAVVLDKKVLTAPNIREQIGHSFVIEGSFSQKEAQDMVIKIRSGSLPAEVRILEERVIGPTLGRDARNQGAISAGIGLVLVILFMMYWYSRAGLYSVFALVMNLILMAGMLSFLGAVLTLPGIAGFILTIGMAVDANVLVYERIREELRIGSIPGTAVDIGFKTAFVTIMDANITTFLAAFILLLMATGPVKGFAVMLMIGIVSSIFTAVFCTRTFFLSYLERKKPETLSIWPIGSAASRNN
ncbi:MAG: protein translocase subunit SecD [Acidobacteria bacterium]|nr:protein translocase subunit SecD [Acidobacteriota bacterium]MCB9398910.1 protein translocase subunit SecD [Acidobacteriota bacterium]